MARNALSRMTASALLIALLACALLPSTSAVPVDVGLGVAPAPEAELLTTSTLTPAEQAGQDLREGVTTPINNAVTTVTAPVESAYNTAAGAVSSATNSVTGAFDTAGQFINGVFGRKMLAGGNALVPGRILGFTNDT
jgi:hypothetical protein